MLDDTDGKPDEHTRFRQLQDNRFRCSLIAEGGGRIPAVQAEIVDGLQHPGRRFGPAVVEIQFPGLECIERG